MIVHRRHHDGSVEPGRPGRRRGRLGVRPCRRRVLGERVEDAEPHVMRRTRITFAGIAKPHDEHHVALGSSLAAGAAVVVSSSSFPRLLVIT